MWDDMEKVLKLPNGRIWLKRHTRDDGHEFRGSFNRAVHLSPTSQYSGVHSAPKVRKTMMMLLLPAKNLKVQL
jgi:hypothetical protein